MTPAGKPVVAPSAAAARAIGSIAAD